MLKYASLVVGLLAMVVLVHGEDAPAEWKAFRPEGFPVEVLMPGTPLGKSTTQDAVKLVTKQYTVTVGEAVFKLGLSSFDVNLKIAPESYFVGARSSMLRNTGGKLLVDKPLKLKDFPGRAIDLEMGTKRMRTVTYLGDRRSYSLIAIFPANDEQAAKDAAKFLDSFKLTEGK